MVTTDWAKFREYKDNGLVKDVFTKKSTMDKLQGAPSAGWPAMTCYVRYAMTCYQQG
jgi:glutamine phosphoribosylpyrophosphate amidotransferase